MAMPETSWSCHVLNFQSKVISENYSDEAIPILDLQTEKSWWIKTNLHVFKLFSINSFFVDDLLNVVRTRIKQEQRCPERTWLIVSKHAMFNLHQKFRL